MGSLLAKLWQSTQHLRDRLDLWAARRELAGYIRQRDRELAKDCHGSYAGALCDLVKAQRVYVESCEYKAGLRDLPPKVSGGAE